MACLPAAQADGANSGDNRPAMLMNAPEAITMGSVVPVAELAYLLVAVADEHGG